VNRYRDAVSGEAFVDALLATAGMDLSAQRDTLIARYNSGSNQTESRALVIRDLTTLDTVQNANYNSAFVLVEYFGYLHRNPDEQGYNFWLNVLNTSDANNYRGMVCSFITSAEYQHRFSNVVSRNNTECSQ
jgi:hypothetical protein